MTGDKEVTEEGLAGVGHVPDHVQDLEIVEEGVEAALGNGKCLSITFTFQMLCVAKLVTSR